MVEVQAAVHFWQILSAIALYLTELYGIRSARPEQYQTLSAVGIYFWEHRQGRLTRPEQCPHCGSARLSKCGQYRRRPRIGSGWKLFKVPIQRFLCSECEVTFSKLPPFLCRYLHYFAYVVEATLEEYSQDPTLCLSSLPLEFEGPSTRTVSRWVGLFYCESVGTWLTCKAQRLVLDGPVERAPRSVLRPSDRLSTCQRVFEASGLRLPIGALLQWARLRGKVRYAPEHSSFQHHPLYA